MVQFCIGAYALIFAMFLFPFTVLAPGIVKEITIKKYFLFYPSIIVNVISFGFIKGFNSWWDWLTDEPDKPFKYKEENDLVKKHWG